MLDDAGTAANNIVDELFRVPSPKPNFIATSNGEIGGLAGLGPKQTLSIERELRVIEITGGRSARLARVLEDGRVLPEDTMIIRNGQTASGIDVFGKKGELIQVGGPGKNSNDITFEKTKKALLVLKDEAQARKTIAQVYYESASSDRFKALVLESQKILGNENVVILKK